MYQIGNAQHPEPGDPFFETEDEAISAARTRCTGDQVLTVWHWTSNKEHVETRFLVYQGDLWKPA